MATATADQVVELDEALREEVCRMKRGLTRGDYMGMDHRIAQFVRDLCRSEPRVRHPMGQYPHAAMAFARAGAPWSDVVAPMNYLKARIWSDVYLAQTVCVMEAIARETNANAIQDHATHRVLNEPSPYAWEALADACETQVAETRILRQVALNRVVQEQK